MPTKFGTPEHWRERAEEARTKAADMRDWGAKQGMLDVAQSYETLAKLAEARATTGLFPGRSK
jgi:hypothetical protein